MLRIFSFSNIDLQNWGTPSDRAACSDLKLIEGVRDDFLFQHVTLPTRKRLGNKSHTLDLALTTENFLLGEIVYDSPLYKADRYVLIVTFRCCAEIANHTQLKSYCDQDEYKSMKPKLDHGLGTYNGCYSDRLPKTILYMELTEGKRPVDRPTLRHKDVIETYLKDYGIDPLHWQTVAEDRSTWRTNLTGSMMTYDFKACRLITR